jgi:hypothetical protein
LICAEHAVLATWLTGGNQLARWEIWDGIRALDYLLTRPEVDPNVSILRAQVAAAFRAHIAALDERLKSCRAIVLHHRIADASL